MRNRLVFLFISGLAGACAATSAQQRRWHGDVAGCGGPSTLTRIDDSVAFAPGDGALLLRGTVAPDGRFAASLNTQPPGKPPFLMSVSGQMDADTARGVYVTPRCQGGFTLARVRPALL